jgi:glycosyltransferase involved in cell wall biosynthesis
MTHLALVAYELESGGISRVAVYLANGFAAAGHDVSLLLCTSAGSRDADFRRELHPGVTYVALGDQHHRSRSWGQISKFAAYRKWLKTAKPDVVIATANNISWFTGLGFALNSAMQASKFGKLFIKTTNPILRENDGTVLTWLRQKGYQWLFIRADAVLTLSDAESRILKEQFPQFPGAFRAVYNPYLTDAFQTGDSGAQCDGTGPLQLLAVGRLEEQKNMTRLIEAFALAKQHAALQSAHLTIAGEGSQMERLRALAQQLGIAGQITFAGFCHDIPAMLRRADMFVLSSNYEGLPAVVIEALASGCRIVSTDCFPAARELLADLPGCEVTARSANALADGILKAASAAVGTEALQDRALDYGLTSAINSHLKAIGLPTS